MKILKTKKISPDVINEIVEALARGGIVVVPSDTVYGISADATSLKAIKKLIAFKQRPAGKAISIFVDNIKAAEEYVEISDTNRKTLENLVPGPYTFILPSKHKVIKKLEAENGTLGIRIPNNSLINQLTKNYKKPITATSANISGTSPHYTVDSLLKSLSQKKRDLIDLVVDFGPLSHNKPSTVIDLTTDNLKILRQGDVTPFEEYISKSEDETRVIAAHFINQIKETSKPIIVILQGDLGVGKTVFTKGVGEVLGTETIVSPTYIVCYEYKTSHPVIKKMHHCDFYMIHEKEEFDHLGISEMLKENSLLIIEWGEKAGDLIGRFKKQGEVFVVNFQHIDETSRKIIINRL